jgi:hypothetical protein
LSSLFVALTGFGRFSVSLAHSLKVKSFGTFARSMQNDFVALGNCFMTVSRRRAANSQQKELQQFHDVTRLIHA